MNSIMFLLVYFCSFVLADMTTPPKNTEKQYFYQQNQLTNPGFELGVSGWTASGGTFSTGTTSTETWLSRYGVWNPSAASQTLTSNTWTITASGAGVLLGECKLKTSDTDYKIQIYNSTDAVVLAEATVVAGGSTSYPTAYSSVTAPILPNGSSKNIQLRLISASNAGNIYVDDCYLGYVKNAISTVAPEVSFSAFKNGGSVTAATTIASWTTTRKDTAGGFNSTTGEYTIRVPGSYFLTFHVGFTSATTIAVDVFVNGSKYQDGTFASADYKFQTAVLIPDLKVGDIITLRPTSNATLASTNTTNVWSMYRIPSGISEAYTGQQLDWRVDANISGANPSLGTAAVTSYTGIENASLTLTNNTSTKGSIPNVFIPCSGTNDSTGTTCSSGNESVGVAFTPPRAGWVQVCIAVSHNLAFSTSGNVASTFQIVKTPNAAQTISESGLERSSTYLEGANISKTSPIKNCANFYLDSVTKTTFRLFYEQTIGGASNTSNVLIGDASASAGDRDIHWSVIPLSSYVAPPVSLGNVNTTPLANGQVLPQIKLFSAKVSSTGVVSDEIGSWINGNCTMSGTGSATADCSLDSGTFTITPNCTCTNSSSPTAHSVICYYNYGSSSSTSLQFYMTANSVLSARNFSVICQGY